MTDRIVEAFINAGYEIYLVGGSVRDKILQIPNKDMDYCTNAIPEETYKILNQFGKPYRIGEKFGTIGLGDIEVTTYRTEQYKNNSRKPEVQFGTSLREDLERRDFTMNAIANNEKSGYIDFHDGMKDIENKIVRCVGDPSDRFSEDPLRMLRAIRFACRFKFSIEKNTYESIKSRHRSILCISQERIQEEFTKIITSDVRKGMTMLRDTGLLSYIAPELVMLTDPRSQGFYHQKNIWGHTLSVAQKVQDDLILRLAAILHDVGKMATRTEDKGKIHFYGHEEVSSILAQSMLRRLRYPSDVVNRVCRLIRYHMQVNYYTPNWSDGTVRKLMDRLGDDIFLSLELAKCDQNDHIQGHHDPVNNLEERVIKLKETIEEHLTIPIDGNDLMNRYNRTPGPWIKPIKDHLHNLVINGTLSPDDKSAAFKVADELLAVEA